MTEVILIRHGETLSNRDKRIQGHADIPLSAVGREQARALDPRLRSLLPARFYSSDLSRCVETAQIALSADMGKNGTNGPPDCPATEALRERCFGEWQGLTLAEIKSRYPDGYRDWRAHAPNFCPPGGEPLGDLSERMVGFIEAAMLRHPGERLALFTHGGAIHAVIRHALRFPPEQILRFNVSNTGVTIIHRDRGEWRLGLLNDTCHLGCISKRRMVEDAENVER